MTRLAIRFLIALSVAGLVPVAIAVGQDDALVVRVYDVSSLAPRSKESLRTFSDADLGPLGARYRESDAYDLEREKIEGMIDQVTELATASLTEEQLENWGVASTSSGRHLVARTSAAGHERIAALLDTLRRAAGTRLQIDVVAITLDPEAVNGEIEDLIAQAVTGRLDDAGRARLLELDEHRGHRAGRVTAEPGRWTTFRRLERIPYLSDFDVEIAQDAQIGDPVTAVIEAGVRMAVRAFPLTDGRTLVRTVTASGDVQRPIRRFSPRTTDIGDVELPVFRGSLVATEALIRPGRSFATVAGSSDGAAGAWNVTLFSLAKAEAPRGASTVAVLPVGALSATEWPHVVHPPGQEGQWEHSGVWMDRHAKGNRNFLRMHADEVIELVNLAIGPALDEGRVTLDQAQWLQGRSLVLRGPRADLDTARRRVAEIEQALLRPVRLSVRLDSVDEAGNRQTVGLLSCPALLGRNVALASYRTLAHVGDYDVEVAQGARISDPNVHTAVGGLLANVEISDGGEGRYHVRLAFRATSLEDPPREIAHSAEAVGVLQSVTERTAHTVSTVDVRAGEPATIPLGGDFFVDDANRLEITLRVD